MEQLLALEMVRVTEAAAIASARFMGRGDRDEADRAATEAMRRTMDEIDIAGTIVIGEGERDEAPMLYIGEQVGRHDGDDRRASRDVDIAVDPLEGTNLVATGQARRDHGARRLREGRPRPRTRHLPREAVRRARRRGPRRHHPAADGELHRIAEALGRKVPDITVIILDRPRHDALIAEVRATGRTDQAHHRRRPVGRHLVRGLGHRRPRGHGHRRRARGRDHRGRAALPGRRDPGPVPVPQRRGARARAGVEDGPRRRGPGLPDRGPRVGRPARVRGDRRDRRATCSRASGSSAAAPGRTRS